MSGNFVESRKVPPIALRTSVIYATVAGLWIFGSDRALVALFGSSPDLVRFQEYKGYAFVAITAGLLYVVLRQQLRRETETVFAREMAEVELKRHRERLELATIAGNVGFWAYEVGTQSVYFSSEWKLQLGYKEHELANRMDEWEKRIHPEDRERVLNALRDYTANPHGRYHVEYRMQHRDCSYRWILSQGMLQGDEPGKPLRMMGSHVDVTAIKQAEAALRERAEIHARLAHIAAVVPGAIISFQEAPDGTRSFPYASPAVLDIYGISPEDIAHDAAPVFERIHPDDAPVVVATVEESRRTLRPWRCEFRFNHPIKGEVWVEGFSLPESQPGGGILWNGFVMDITARKRAELRVHQMNRVYAVLSDINQTIIRVREPQLLCEAVCRIAVEKGQFRMAWIGRVDRSAEKVIPIAHAGVEDGYLAALDIDLRNAPRSLGPTAQAVNSGKHVICTDIARDPDMEPWRKASLARGYRSVAALPIRVRGEIVNVLILYGSEPDIFDAPELQLLDEMAVDLSFALEVSEGEAGRLQTEASSRENEERFRQLAENIHEVFWLTDPVTRRILYVSPVYEKVWGRTVEALYAHPNQWIDSVYPDDRAKVLASFEQQAAGTYDEEHRIVRPDGAVRWIRARAFPVRDSAGEVYRIAGIAEDVTERKQLEEQFFRAQRLEAIGTLASGIAHDLNNILAPIMMCAPMLRMGLPATDFEKMLGTIEASTRRGADLVRQLLVFGRGVDGGRGPVAPKALVGEMLKIMRETFPKNIEVRSKMPDDLWDMVGDATQLHQVLLNLCVNARDAMPHGGELLVGAENVELDAKSAAKFPNARAGSYVRLLVKDSGTGIAPEHAGKIFDPFFTTKPPGKGTGLGLSTVLGIVKSHGGFVHLDTEPGRGSCFVVFVPAERNRGTQDARLGVADTAGGNGELILLVEDEVSIRDVVADILVRQNYRVMTAEDGVEGETLYRENIHDIALIITDLDMPRMDGVRLIQAIRHISSKVPIVVSTGLRSGRTAQERTTEIDDLGAAAVLEKPYAAEDILAAVNVALHGKK